MALCVCSLSRLWVGQEISWSGGHSLSLVKISNYLGYILIVYVSLKRRIKCMRYRKCSVNFIPIIEHEQDF